MAAITSGLATAERRVAALERDLGRVAMLDRALASDDRAFKLAAAFTVAIVTTLAIMDEAERARQAGITGFMSDLTSSSAASVSGSLNPKIKRRALSGDIVQLTKRRRAARKRWQLVILLLLSAFGSVLVIELKAALAKGRFGGFVLTLARLVAVIFCLAGTLHVGSPPRGYRRAMSAKTKPIPAAIATA